MGLRRPGACRATHPQDACCYGSGRGKTVLGQPEMSSYRDHNVIWTLGRYPLTRGTGNLVAQSGRNCDLDHADRLSMSRELCHIGGRGGQSHFEGGYSSSVRVAGCGTAHQEA
ncbi:hypothetical protein L842_1091 [Mycobacterium intracellulare MIN_052511_1280]|nr:hypothetical protein L842_1091 [Mycobacterium intracellulare MIN_052511_1280]